MKKAAIGFLILGAALGCSKPEARQASPTDAGPESALREALTFHASFDGKIDADFAEGDPALYSASSWQERTGGTPGLPADTLARHVEQAGQFGDALEITSGRDPAVLYFEAAQNVGYQGEDWSGTVSFWLNLDPDEDLAPGYSDPFLLTSKRWNDAALFVDFTQDDHPRHFRFAAFADHNVWNPQGLDWEDVPTGERPMIEVTQPPFERGQWTHVVMTFERFNTGEENGVMHGYLNGDSAGTLSGRNQTFTWDPEQAVIAFGINYVGLFDELSIFNRALTAEEVETLYRLDGGVKSLL